MNRCVRVSSEKAFWLYIDLGNDANGLVGTDIYWYVIIPSDITPSMSLTLLKHNVISLEISHDELAALKANTPMVLAHAINTGQIVHPGRKYQHVWKAVCESAGIIEVPLSSIARHALANGVQKAKVVVANGVQKATDVVANGAHNAIVYCLSCAITVYNSHRSNRK